MSSYKINLNLDKLTLSLLFLMGLTINSNQLFSFNLFLEALLIAAVFLSLLSFSRIVVYVLMEKQCIAKFALVFYGFFVSGNMLITFFISYRISLLFESILQYLNSFLFNKTFLNSPFTSS